MIKFNVPSVVGNEINYINKTIETRCFSGDGYFTKKCTNWFEEEYLTYKALLTPSCTHSLEMAALLLDINDGDEIIMPSYTFVSTANAFVLRGARIVFIDIRPDTMNINEQLIVDAITNKTKAIVVVHYAGVSCEMDVIMDIARRYNLAVVEDAAQGVNSFYKGKALGTIGHIGCYSFHETKNYHCGEGGAILLNDEKYIERAEIIREKGTDRSKFYRGQLDKYSWIDLGSSYLASELNAAFLYSQLERANEINNIRLERWNEYYKGLLPLMELGKIHLPIIPKLIDHNAHMFYMKVKDIEERSDLINYLKENDVMSVFHYIPLHTSDAGKKFGSFFGNDKYTTSESERLLRLPLYYDLELNKVKWICELIIKYYL
ncbi:dTDP-4-amino-4,6-dideoxygalactose transaminase [Cytobacillus solani]|uniref:TDP-4-oxo-6-deoxy-D-glucose aminotransferase n=1 Tax=Cytobacillus solani TaxID=1637975 RepID=A0A0Q3VJC7_9BACI|nr:dTDP-4-amino-4,6-dideoxygalactose transaminase [Cytobacillus solani]KQL21327.1 TDP-4-oxo-6-deoxy-D-glucose aminotransferase [Cytobacillus solani]